MNTQLCRRLQNEEQLALNAKTTSSTAVTNVLRIDDVYYDTLKLAAVHPGGSMVVKLANGTDATRIFVSYHRRRFPHAKYKHMQIAAADVLPGAVPEEKATNFDLYLELCKKVQPLLAPTGGFAPWYYFLKAAFWCILMVALDLYCVFCWRPHYLTVILSLCMAMVGLNVQHDANHGALHANPVVNRLFGLTQDYLGGSSLSWIIHHNLIHHIYTNEPGRDMDLDIPLLRLHCSVPMRSYHKLQHVYLLFLEAVFGLAHVISNLLFLWRVPEKLRGFVVNEWMSSCFIVVTLPLRFVFTFMHAPSVFDALLGSFLLYSVGGMYLSFFFLLSHNFIGVNKEKVGNESRGTQCFFARQVETSSSVGGWWLGHVNGGLNYQIEHHLFPRVHHSYYYYISPIVREFCAKHGVSYVFFNTVWDNAVSTFTHLAVYGHREKEGKAG